MFLDCSFTQCSHMPSCVPVSIFSDAAFQFFKNVVDFLHRSLQNCASHASKKTSAARSVYIPSPYIYTMQVHMQVIK